MAIPSLEDVVMLLIGICIGFPIGWSSYRIIRRRLRRLMRRL